MELNIRKANQDDCYQLFKWVNDPMVRESSFNSDRIEWDSHQVWFKEQLSRKDCWIYMATNKDEKSVGQVRFDQVSISDVEVDVSVSSKYRGNGVGLSLIKFCIEKLRSDAEIKYVIAWVKESNISSLKTFIKAGFIVKKTILRNRIKSICLIFSMKD
jgi:UDP-2,4-diacetamido-2,4,6-trideoxy-beta-L-altropyranose hydrolase